MKIGKLAEQDGKSFPLQALECGAGFYLGTLDEEGFPYSRESQEYFPTRADAESAIASGKWTQRDWA